jgi:FAD:protein FMN transferase
MSRCFFGLLLFVCLGVGPHPSRYRIDKQQLKRFQFTENKMGSPFRLIFYYTDSLQANSIANECFSIVDSLNEIFSDYTSSSEVGRLALDSNFINYKPSDELFSMIVRSQQAWNKSMKTFDVTIGALTHLWRMMRKANTFPSATAVSNARRSGGFQNLRIDLTTKTISSKVPGLRLDFGGIVKGYAAQRIIDHLKNKHITMALADAGGDMAMGAAPPGQEGWLIGINLPEKEDELMEKKLSLEGCAVATSGDLYQFIVHNGKKYSHIIDPLTGYGVTTQRNVTVIASDGAKADWLATACSILPVEKAIQLATKEKAALLIATMQQGKIVIHKTQSFDRYFKK